MHTRRKHGRGPYANYGGQRFGSLLILWPCGWKPEGRKRRVVWSCQCDCGKVVVGWSSDIRRLRTRSCGCKKLATHNVNAHNLFAQYRNKAKARGITWALTFEQFLDITQRPCYFTGWPPSQVCKRSIRVNAVPYVWNGIDRLDNTKGYTLDNSVACNGEVNKAKLTMTEAHFIALCKAVTLKHGGNDGEE